MSVIFPRRKEIVLGKVEKRWEPLPAILLAVPYAIWAGFRTNGFGDTAAYRQTFLQAPSQLSELAGSIAAASKDKGYAAFEVIVKWIIGNSDVIYFLIIAAIQLMCIVIICRKYSCNYWNSIFLFIASTEYMSWCHNGIRQFLAVALIFAATDLLLKSKYIPLLIVILTAATIHASALLMIPIVFIVQGKAWNVKTLLCIIVTIFILIYVESFTGILEELLSNTNYSSMVTDWKEWQDEGTNPIRVLVYSIPMILSLIGYKQIRKLDDNFVNILTNLSILTSAIAMVSMVTSGIFIGRLIIYPAIYSSYLLLPWEIEHLFSKESAKLIRIFMVIGYVGFFYYQMHSAWGLI